MKFETLILLIIAFNVVMGLLQRRAKKAKEEAQRTAERAAREGGSPSGSPGSARRRSPAREAEWEEVEVEGWEDAEGEEPWEERPPERPARPPVESAAARAERLRHEAAAREEEALRARAERERRNQEERRREREDRERGRGEPPAKASQPAREKSRLGREILEQLAKELGLKFPPHPKPAGPAARPASAAPAVPAWRAPPAAESAPARPVSRRAAGTDTQARAKHSLPPALAALKDPRKAREAVLLREILGPPVSLRGPRRPGSRESA